MKLTVRETDDLDLVQELDRQIFPTTPALTEDELAGAVWWVARMGKEPVAFGGLRLEDGGAKAMLLRAGVLAQARGAGLQRRLVRAREAYARRHGVPRLYTYVWAYGLASMNNLIKCGYRPYYVERTLYGEKNYQTFMYFEKHLRSARRQASVVECQTQHAA